MKVAGMENELFRDGVGLALLIVLIAVAHIGAAVLAV
jgi:hypothetical protein